MCKCECGKEFSPVAANCVATSAERSKKRKAIYQNYGNTKNVDTTGPVSIVDGTNILNVPANVENAEGDAKITTILCGECTTKYQNLR